MTVSETPILSSIHAPEDLRRLSPEELLRLADELRNTMLRVIAANGGHLGANFGVVELTLALLRVFDVPDDRIIWDVGHQCYCYKLLTGRQKEFESLRRFDGCCGFPVRGESPFDCYGAGHAGIAISAALGMCAALPKDSRRKIIAVVGDGALNSGVALEGLNQVRAHGRNLVIILNDNKMAIAPNVGAIASYLNRIIIGRKYRYVKNLTKSIINALPRSEALARHVRKFEDAAKGILLPGGFFEELGIRYLGPVAGHNTADLERTFAAVKQDDHPVLIHVITEKGHGYAPALAAPERFHGISRFEPDSGAPLKPSQGGFSAAFGNAMNHAAEHHPELCAVVAAMADGTGLREFSRRFPERFYDVGIAEAHAVTFASGLAASGKHPVTAVYATFMQRAMDHVFHDVCLMNLPVVFALDRAGVVEDGPTHHGIYDLGFYLGLPNLTILAPADEAEVAPMLEFALGRKSPVLIRYPRGASGMPERTPSPLQDGHAEVLRDGRDLALWALGGEVARALRIAEILNREHGFSVKVVNVRFLKPFDAEMFRYDAAVMPVFTLEDHVAATGLGAVAARTLAGQKGVHGCVSFGWPGDRPIPHGAAEQLRRRFHLDEESLAEAAAAGLKKA